MNGVLTVRALVLPLSRQASVEQIAPDLPTMQKLVGGFLEAIHLDDHVVLWLNEEGALHRMPVTWPAPPEVAPAFVSGWIQGPAFLTRSDAEGDTVSLTDEDIAKWGGHFCDCQRGATCNISHDPAQCSCGQCSG